MSTNETEPAVESVESAPPAPIVLDFDLDAGDLEDIEEYTGLGNALSLVSEAIDGIPPGKQVQALIKRLPAKMVTAVLGAARRRADPTWTMDRWRQFRFIDLGTPNGNSNGDGAGEGESDPTQAATTPPTGGASQNGSPTSAPAPTRAPTG